MTKPKKTAARVRTKTCLEDLLEELPWPSELDVNGVYGRLQDDHDGTNQGRLFVMFSPDGDSWVSTDAHRGPALRFRGPLGGGNSQRTRNALVILALAIKLDEDE